MTEVLDLVLAAPFWVAVLRIATPPNGFKPASIAMTMPL